MRPRWLTFVIFVASSAILLSASAPRQTAAQLYQSGVYAEEIEGNLQKAIGIYEQVLKQFPNDRDTAANAQLHIGLCYERMGVEKAREAFEKVIKNYPGQGAAVAMAREKLDSLLRAASLGKKSGSGPTLRQVQTPPGQDVLGRVSPDGKYLADVGGGTCNVWIADLATGKQRHLTPADKNCSQGSPYGPRWSPDSTKLVFTWRDPEGIYDLRVVGLDGSAPRVLLPAGAASWSEALDWSPDGKYILAGIIDRKEQMGFGLVSVADGTVRYLRSSLRYDPQDGRFSPDGLYIAYSRKIGTDGNGARTRDVFLLAADGSREIPIVEHPADDAFVDWMPDGRGILFGSDREGTPDLWALAVEKGQAQGVPTLVRRRVGPLTPLGLTTGGALYYRTPAPFMDVYTARLDPKTGLVSGPPKKEPLSWEGSNRWPVWSPDGRRLAYVSARPTIVGPFQPGRAREYIVCVYSADTNLVREYRHEKVFTYPRWSPDGRHLYVAASSVDGRGIYSLDLERGEYTPYYRAGEDQPMLYFQFSGDGTWLVWVASRDDASVVMRRDTRTGEEKELDRVPGLSIAGLALSPDARHLAWVPIADKTTKVLKVMPFPDGAPKVIRQLTETGRGRTEMSFAPDGRFIYYTDLPSAGGGDWHLWRIPTEGGPPQDMGLGVGNSEQLGVHPDGSRITFAAPTINPDRSQVWVLENFLPARK